MPLRLDKVQRDYDAAKAALKDFQAAVDVASAALLKLEQSCEALEADGVAPFAKWFREHAANASEGYQTYGNAPGVVVYARAEGARNLATVHGGGPIESSDAAKTLRDNCGFSIVP